jgi:hypothetical protein
MQNLKCVIIPVIIVATGIATKGVMKKFERPTRKIFSRFTTKR